MSTYLQEAFKALDDVLNEEDFNLSSIDSFKDAKDFVEDDKIDFTDVIDPEAETEEELKDSYIGNVILDCCVCHSKIYKNPDEVEIDEAEGLANVSEECPFCYSTDGYTVVGMVAPYKEEKEEDEVEVEETTDEDDDVDESLKEAITSEDFDWDSWYDVAYKALYQAARKFKAPDEAIRDACSYFASEWGNSIFGPFKKFDESLNKSLKESIVGNAKNWLIDKEGKSPREAEKIINNLPPDEIEKIALKWVYKYKDESFKRRNHIKEHFEKVEIETDKEKMELTSEENGKVTVTTEPKDSEEEIIAPVPDEVQSKMNPINEPEESEEDVDDENVEDIDVTEFSEEDFNDLGESYLKKVYENVDFFKTCSTKAAGNKLMIEGIIGFKSGKQKKTSFVFESKDINKSGKVRFIGENLQLSRGKKSFTMTGSINNGRFIAESLNYNYRQKNSDGKSTRVYGTVRK